jgi:Notch-like protein
VDGNSTDNSQVIADVFNEYFLSVAEKIHQQDHNINSNNNVAVSDIRGKNSDNNNSNPAHYITHAFNSCLPNIQLKFSTKKEIENVIKSLKPKNTCGYDEIFTKLLKMNSTYISSPLNHTRNSSSVSGMFSQCLKYSIVKLLFKKGDRTVISSYRPISILTPFSKIFEKVMYNRLP